MNYTYDFEDRLLSTSTGVQIVYDGDGNRVAETSNGATTKYLVDGLTPTSYAQLAEETVGGTVATQFTYGLTRISQNRAGALSYYGYDAGWSVRELVNSSSTITDTYDYDAFGDTVARTGSTVNEFLYRGEQFDVTLGVYYLRARYYIPGTGRFLTADKFQLPDRMVLHRIGRLLEEASYHPYTYAHGDGGNLIDPSGFEVVEGQIGVVDELLAESEVEDGLEIHHIIPACFAEVLGV